MVVTKLEDSAESGGQRGLGTNRGSATTGMSDQAKRPGTIGRRAAAFIVLTMVMASAGLPGAAQETTTTTTTTATTTTASTTQETTTTTTATTAPTTAPASTQAETTAPPTTQAETTTTTVTTTSGSSGTTTTQNSTPPASEEERKKIEAAETAKAREVDAANARLGELTNALAVLRSDVETQAADVDIANRRLATAQAIAAAAQEDVAELEAQVEELEYGLSDQAIRSFKGETVEGSAIAVASNPNEAIRMQALLARATQSDIDFKNELAGVKEDLVARRADADEAVALADESRSTSEEQLQALEEDRLAQGQLAAAAETRLDHLLSERAALARLGANYDNGVDVEAALVEQLANTPAPTPSSSSSGSSGTGSTVTKADIRLAGAGIEVHVTIVDQIRRLLADAAADGVVLAGGGYRDSAGQIAARRNNCGTSNFAIYEMRSSRCRPPTARPGRSMHEQGRAIDFTYNGKLIRSRSGRGWEWLKANAANYGLINLPSEPWHWSTNGR